MSIVVFEVTKGAPTSWRLPQKEVMAEKPGTGELKHIAYYRGQSSIFVEEVTSVHKELKPNKVPDFTLNPTRNKCELRFDDKDKALFKYITTHPYYKKGRYVMYSEEIESKKLLSKAEAIEKALDYIKEPNDLKLRAIGLSVLGYNIYGKAISIIKAQLKEKAINNPKEIIRACEDDLFDNKYTVSLALCSGIIKTNNTMTAIVWADNEGRILNIATGEDFIEKLAKYLSQKTAESRALLQEIGSRLNLAQEQEEAETAEAKRIKELEEKLAAIETDYEIVKGKNEKLAKANEQLVKETNPSLEDMALEEARKRYKDLIGKIVPIRYHNNLEWIEKKIQEKLSSE